MGGLSHTVSGDIASFRTPSRVPIESLKFHFLPKQEGSGDPSPTNVRPITGWTGFNWKLAGNDLLNVNEFPIVFPNGQTVYGGYVDIISGKLVCDKVKIVIDDATAFAYSDRDSVSRFSVSVSYIGPANAGNLFVMFNY